MEFLYGQEMAYFDAKSKGLVQINHSKHFPIDQYLHDRMTPATLSPSPLAYEKPIHPAEMPCIATRPEIPIDDTNKSTPDDKYPWLDPDDPRRNMTDKEILRMKLNLKDSILNEKEKEEFLMKVEQFTDVFSLRDEIGSCPFIEVHLKLKDETPFFVRPYPMREEQKKVIQKEMDRLEHLGIIHKGLTGYSSPIVLVKAKQHKDKEVKRLVPEKVKRIQGQNDSKNTEAKRHMIEKAKIEALIEKHRLRTPKIPDEVNKLGTGKNAIEKGQEGTSKGKPPYEKATKDIQIKKSCKKGIEATNAEIGKTDTLLGDPVANTATGIANEKEKGQKDKTDLDDIGIFEFIFEGLPELPELEGVDEDRLRDLQNTVQEQLHNRDEERERNITK